MKRRLRFAGGGAKVSRAFTGAATGGGGDTVLQSSPVQEMKKHAPSRAQENQFSSRAICVNSLHMIHPTAVIHPGAQIDPTATIGPHAVIDGAVTLGAGCVVGPFVHLTGNTSIGARNHFHAGCVMGDAPQDLKYQGGPTRLVIGHDNVFREHVTIHRSSKMEEDTVIGSNNFLMTHGHVGHNSRLGNHVLIANGAMLGGHVTVEDRAFISGNCLVHQFVRIGTLALMQGGAAISKDLPPYTIARGGVNSLCGLNVMGLRRAGYDAAQRLELRRLYQALFRHRGRMNDALARARLEFTSPAARVLLDFFAGNKRGVCTSSRNKPGLEE